MVERGYHWRLKMLKAESIANDSRARINDYPWEENMNFPKKIRIAKDLKWGEKCYLAEIVSLDKITNGHCFYNIKALAERFFICHLTIFNYTKKLLKLGYIHVLTIEKDGELRRILKPISSQTDQ